ncbi:MAG: peptide-methionine (S)-S-oxide reductase MsrA [Cyanobacteria bacterium J06632_22]
MDGSPGLQIATFGAGCFWKTEDVFSRVPGVHQTSVGYMGGHFANPCYLDVLSRITGHAEVAQLHYDAAMISYAALLETFWTMHDPTTLNRQGADRGEQYRSIIFYHSPQQQALAHQSKATLDQSGRYEQPIVTLIEPAKDYWLATKDHQQYLAKQRLSKSQR